MTTIIDEIILHLNFTLGRNIMEDVKHINKLRELEIRLKRSIKCL